MSASRLLLLLLFSSLGLSSPIRPLESRRGDPLMEAQDFLNHILSTLNLTEVEPPPHPPATAAAAHVEPPEYMLELYERFANDRTAVPSVNIVRSYKNEDSSPHSVSARGAAVHPLLFNLSMPQHERVALAELRLFTLLRKAAAVAPDCKVTVYKLHEGGVAWRRRGQEEEEEEEELEEVATKHIRARDNAWVSFDLTHAVALWRKSGRAAHRLEVHITALGSEVDIDRRPEGKHDAVLVVFSDDQSRRRGEQQQLEGMMQHEGGTPPPAERHGGGGGVPPYDAPPRIRRDAKSEPCKRTPLYVNFRDIGWDAWIIQPLGYEAYECNGVCNPPMTSEVSPTKHAIVQALLSVRSPDRASRACCVPTRLEPISLLYHDNGVVTFNHKYEDMVVAECGCR